MAIVYCCWTTGNDTTGDGSYGTPYKTITKASMGLTGGDEVRVSKSAAHTALTGTLTWTDGSTSVTTSADLTGELAATDMIGKDADDDMWWEVDSLNSTTITLRHVYSGTGEAVASYKMGFHDYGSPEGTTTQVQIVSASGSSVSSLLKISGGWDLSTQTQTGWSFFCVTHATNRYGIGFYSFNKSYIEAERMSFARVNTAFQLAGSWIYFTDMHGYSFGGSPVTFTSTSNSFFKRLKLAGREANFLTHVSVNLKGLTWDDCWFVSFTGSSAVGVGQFGGQSIVKKLTVRCCVTGMSGLNPRARHGDLTVERCTTGLSLGDSYGDRQARVGKLTVRNCTTGFTLNGLLRVGTLVLSDNTTDYTLSITYSPDTPQPLIAAQRWQDVAGDSRMVHYYGTVYRDTTDARSGACLKATPSSATDAMWISLGKHRVTSVATDIVLSVYAKDDATFNGDVALMALMNDQVVSDFWVEKTMDTTYGQHTLTVDTLDLVNGEWLELVARVRGTAGSVFFDDFAAA